MTLGFFAGGKLKKIEIRGGLPQTLCDAPEGRGGTWNRDGVIVFGPGFGPIYRVSAAGGPAAQLTRLRPVRSPGISGRPFCRMVAIFSILPTARAARTTLYS